MTAYHRLLPTRSREEDELHQYVKEPVVGDQGAVSTFQKLQLWRSAARRLRQMGGTPPGVTTLLTRSWRLSISTISVGTGTQDAIVFWTLVLTHWYFREGTCSRALMLDVQCLVAMLSRVGHTSTAVWRRRLPRNGYGGRLTIDAVTLAYAPGWMVLYANSQGWPYESIDPISGRSRDGTD